MHIGRKIAHLYKCHVEIMHVVPFICNCFKMPPFCCIYGVQYLWFYKLQMFFDITKDHIIIASKDISEATLSKYLHQDNWKTWMKNIVLYVWIIRLTSWMCHSLSINHDFICVSSLSVAQDLTTSGIPLRTIPEGSSIFVCSFSAPTVFGLFLYRNINLPTAAARLTLLLNCERNNVESNTSLTTAPQVISYP